MYVCYLFSHKSLLLNKKRKKGKKAQNLAAQGYKGKQPRKIEIITQNEVFFCKCMIFKSFISSLLLYYDMCIKCTIIINRVHLTTRREKVVVSLFFFLRKKIYYTYLY